MSEWMGGCPHCGHEMDRDTHAPDVGCTTDWEWDDNGIATKQGCDCPLTLASDA